jgi:vacuolar-type H+-ATPase subunit E/Vma4
MPDINEKLDIFKQLVLEDAAKERNEVLQKVEEERSCRLQAAEAEIKRETDAKVQARANIISGESGREISRRMLANKRVIATRREEIAHEVFEMVREKILAFTQTPDYLPHLKKLYVEAFSALGNPYDGVIWLRPQDMGYAKELGAALPGRHVTFQEGSFVLGGLIVDCHSKLLRADQSYDTALGDLDGHFAELFGLSLADD